MKIEQTCTRRLQFCAGHRVMGHESKCRNLHGHNYVVWITAAADQLDDLDRVIDFAVLKERVGGWIDEHWDHGFVLCHRDIEAIQAVSGVGKQKLHLITDNPTAESLAAYLLLTVCPKVLKDTGVRATQVLVEETENCSAIAREKE